MTVRRTIAILVMAVAASEARAQDQDHADHQTPAAASDAWQWHAEGNVFFGFNYQYRKFRDFDTWESQNWMMANAERAVGKGRVQLITMASLEAWTLKRLGSPQVFQTGETYQRAALIDYQHPHDLIMGLGGQYRVPIGRVTTMIGLDLAGPATIGPAPFMHRPSARDNPQTPLAHHHLDSTHITPGVVRGGVEAGPWRLEGSWFRGLEPDEDRFDIDLGPLDSYAVRLGWNRGPWSTQASAAWLTKPERVTPYDAKRLTASVSYFRGSSARSVAWMAAVGQNREIHGNVEAYLFEASIRPTARDGFYTRLESVAKDILDVGFHPVNTFHVHRQSQVGALTGGYIRDILRLRVGVFGVGADVTGYSVPKNLLDSYGSPASFHLFVRYRGATSSQAAHVH
jgi:hypothetical protein